MHRSTYYLCLPGSLTPEPREVQKYLLSGLTRKSKTSADVQKYLLSGPSRKSKTSAEVQKYLLSGPTRKSKTSAERGAEVLITWAFQEV